MFWNQHADTHLFLVQYIIYCNVKKKTTTKTTHLLSVPVVLNFKWANKQRGCHLFYAMTACI